MFAYVAFTCRFYREAFLASSLKWRWGVVAATAMMLLALYPQLKLWINRGADYQGAYAYNDIDEVAYSAYLQALIDGRPRRNDPYTGLDLAGDAPKRETFFSIQFLSPMVIAAPARWFGVSASTAMTVTGALSAFLTTLFLFWLLGLLTRDGRLAAMGALAVLCVGTLAAGEGAIMEIIGQGVAYPYLPFLRRYVPAAPFPFFFMFSLAMWKALLAESKRTRVIWVVIAISAFAILIYSYFYLWTAAAAFAFCFALLWLARARSGPEAERSWRGLGTIVAIAAGSVAMALPYFWLLSQRDPAADDLTLLTSSHRPDLLRVPEIIGYVVLIALAVAIRQGRIQMRDRGVLVTAAFAITPFILFNQQILTGRSLQPIHYQVFIGNYLAALSVVLVLWLLWRGVRTEGRLINRRAFVLIGLAIFGWGMVEAKYTTRVLDAANVVRDQGVPVQRQLALEAVTAPATARTAVVLPLNLIQGDDQPTFAPQPVLWARHQFAFTGTSWTESKQRFYQLMYYSGIGPDQLSEELNRGNFVYVIALFGWGRATDRLTAEHMPLKVSEAQAEVQRYADYVATFDRNRAGSPELSYVITHIDATPDLSNLDRWYERDQGKQFGEFILYKVRRR